MPNDIPDARTMFTDATAAQRLGTHKATICRWRTRGIPLPNGSRLRLEYIRYGKRAYIEPDALRAFLEQLTAADRQRNATRDRRELRAAPRRSASRTEQAEREARELGI